MRTSFLMLLSFSDNFICFLKKKSTNLDLKFLIQTNLEIQKNSLHHCHSLIEKTIIFLLSFQFIQTITYKLSVFFLSFCSSKQTKFFVFVFLFSLYFLFSSKHDSFRHKKKSMKWGLA